MNFQNHYWCLRHNHHKSLLKFKQYPIFFYLYNMNQVFVQNYYKGKTEFLQNLCK
ncbi:hypothetical protein HMPREF1535_02102 [Parabacteroides goldsteinii DSM 19448 = WAL 12034]|uniref:Uncharacterized protein n=1 Tax=Parabacteroides goldsteinii DSM 19448 = WAL 12034 TaxID=927665 RepID=A0A0F5JEE7_9BACT|nr:hypothetical protein HMPREF1535_02102 [Parabacteroides goldsteinii DSM 19448 = WAL 12034]